MSPGGAYDHHSEYQMRAAQSESDLTGAIAAQIVPDEKRGSVVFADYGCAQGRVSNVLLRVALERLRAAHPDFPVCVYHNDLLSNDWAGLLTRLRDEDSYLRLAGGPITPLVSATSFYQPVTPRHIVDLGISFAAVQWLAAPGPAGSGSALYFDQLEGAARNEMAAQAHADWTRFLDLRARELAPGGRMVIDVMCVPDGGVAAGHDLWRAVRATCIDLAAEGLLDRDRLDDYVIPVYERSVEEARQPFDKEIGQRLQLDDFDVRAVPNPITDRYRSDGDAAAFARDFVGFFRAWSEPSIRFGLGLNDITVAELYRRVEARIHAEVDAFSFEVHTMIAVISRHD
jgi:hypothetical protein